MDMKLILCATDGSAFANMALDLAADLAKAKGAKVLVVHVQPFHGSSGVWRDFDMSARLENGSVTEAEMLRDAAQRVANDGARRLRQNGVEDVDTLVLEGDPARQIVDAATARKADAIVIGSRGLGDLEGLLLGSVSHKVAHLARCTCIIAR